MTESTRNPGDRDSPLRGPGSARSSSGAPRGLAHSLRTKPRRPLHRWATCGPGITLSSDGFTATFTDEDAQATEWALVTAEQTVASGQCCWEVELSSFACQDNLMIGAVQPGSNHDRLNHSSCTLLNPDRAGAHF